MQFLYDISAEVAKLWECIRAQSQPTLSAFEGLSFPEGMATGVLKSSDLV